MEKTEIKKGYKIGKNSILQLEGKTNVDGFTCVCKQDFSPQKFIVERFIEGENKALFHQTVLSIPVKSMDCGNLLMNLNMQKALHASRYPAIGIQFIEVKWDHPERIWEAEDWVDIKALTKISINGRSNNYWLNISAKKLDDNRFHFRGNKAFCMSDFGVTPPTALMGMVKVRDEIRIKLDLEITVD